jgi:NAD+ synthase
MAGSIDPAILGYKNFVEYNTTAFLYWHQVDEMVSLSINTDLATSILTGFLETEITRSGFSRAVIGLSGGIDSALSCFLAAKALGPENVLAVRMPYRLSSSASLEHAQLVIDALGVQSSTISITEMVDPYLDNQSQASKVRQGNVMARMRMIVLYDQSEAFEGLVVGTGNKTELLLGYSTLYGDSACAMNPLGDLYKTQVRQLSAALGVPQAIIEKAPTADLWLNQTDEDELGFTYADVDQLLYLLVDQRYSPEDCVAAGFDPDFVARVVERVRRNHFKRILPPIAKLSNRTIGYDFLYLRDWGT